MSVKEYANDVNLEVATIMELCKKLKIQVQFSEDMLDDDAIIMLDNEIANLIIYLLSEKASFITGAVVPIDGGYTAQ